MSSRTRSLAGSSLLDQGQSITSFMIRNMPGKLSRENVMSQFDSKGFAGAYDFFHLPLRTKVSKTTGQRTNLGRAFINFLRAEDASLFKQVFEGLSLDGGLSNKVCEIEVSLFQGLEANLRVHSRQASAEDPIAPVAFGGSGGQSSEWEVQPSSSSQSQGQAQQIAYQARRPLSMYQMYQSSEVGGSSLPRPLHEAAGAPLSVPGSGAYDTDAGLGSESWSDMYSGTVRLFADWHVSGSPLQRKISASAIMQADKILVWV